MSLLVEYHIKEDGAEAQTRALETLVAELAKEGTEGFSYTGFATEDPTRFLAIFEFADAAGKARFLESRAFAQYRDTASERMTRPPSTTTIRRIAGTTPAP